MINVEPLRRLGGELIMLADQLADVDETDIIVFDVKVRSVEGWSVDLVRTGGRRVTIERTNGMWTLSVVPTIGGQRYYSGFCRTAMGDVAREALSLLAGGGPP